MYSLDITQGCQSGSFHGSLGDCRPKEACCSRDYRQSSPVLRSGEYHEVASFILPFCRSTSTTHMPKKRGIARNLLFTVRTVVHQQQVELVAGDFNGAGWRRQSGNDSLFISSIEEAFVNTNLPLPPGPTPWWMPRGVPGEWSDVCGFLKPPGSEDDRNHGVYTIPNSTLGHKEKDQSCHHEVWIHLLHVNARLVDRVSRDDKHRRPISRKRNSLHDHSKERRQHQ